MDAALLICDEPTTALDVTTQRQYLDLLKELQDTTGMARISSTTLKGKWRNSGARKSA